MRKAARRTTTAPAAKAARKQTRTPARGQTARTGPKSSEATERDYNAPAVLRMYRFIVPTLHGPFHVLVDTDGAVRWCDWAAKDSDKLSAMKERWYRDVVFEIYDGNQAPSEAAAAAEKGREVANHLDAFFNPPTAEAATPAGLQRSLDAIPVALPRAAGPYTQKVWHVLRKRVPAGRCVSYKDLAALVAAAEKGDTDNSGGGVGSSRAVGRAMALNPIVVTVPCHRVLGSNQNLHGYSCGLEKKVWLLRHEKAPVLQGKLAALENETRVSTKESRR